MVDPAAGVRALTRPVTEYRERESVAPPHLTRVWRFTCCVRWDRQMSARSTSGGWQSPRQPCPKCHRWVDGA